MSWRQLNCLSQYLHWSEPQLFNVELSDLDIPEEHLVEVFGHLRRLNRVQRSVLSGVGHSWLRPRLCPRLPLHRRGRRKQRGYQSRSSDHPLALALRPDGSLDAGSGPYQVHGRIVIGSNDNGDFTFATMEQTCNLGVFTHSKEVPSGVAALQR
jgi:hypothetical protein